MSFPFPFYFRVFSSPYILIQAVNGLSCPIALNLLSFYRLTDPCSDRPLVHFLWTGGGLVMFFTAAVWLVLTVVRFLMIILRLYFSLYKLYYVFCKELSSFMLRKFEWNAVPGGQICRWFGWWWDGFPPMSPWWVVPVLGLWLSSVSAYPCLLDSPCCLLSLFDGSVPWVGVHDNWLEGPL